MEKVRMNWELLRGLLARIGPYGFVEIVLPGGTLIALLVYLYSRRVEKPAMPVSIWRSATRLGSVRPRVPRNRYP